MTAILDATILFLLAEDEAIEGRAATFRGLYPDLAELHPIKAPEILATELAELIHKRLRGHIGDSFAERLNIHRHLLLGIDLVPTREGARHRIGVLQERYDLSAYDAAYLEVAQRKGDAILITEDKKLLAAGRKELGQERCKNLAALEDHLYPDEGV